MKKDLKAISEGLYQRGISDEELAELRAHAQRVKTGASLANLARSAEHTIIYAAVAETYKKWPEKKTAYKGCEEKSLRDMKLVMRYCVYSAALDDPAYARDKMHYWFRTILNAFGFGKDFIEDAYRIVQKRAVKALPEKEGLLPSGMIDDAIEVYNS